MRNCRLQIAIALLMAGPTFGCWGGASSEPAYYALSAQAGSAQRRAPALIEVRQPALPGYLDRSQLVLSKTETRLTLSKHERWAEPLGEMVGRILAEDLALRLPDSTVFTEMGSITAAPHAIVEVDLRHFEPSQHAVKLVAVVGIKQPQGEAELQRYELTRSRGPPPANVEALSSLLAELAEHVAQQLVSHAARHPNLPERVNASHEGSDTTGEPGQRQAEAAP